LNFYTNDVVIKRADSTIIPTIGMEVLDEDTIITNDSSRAEILYADSSTLYIDENSSIATSGAEKRSVFISVGRVWAKIKKLIKGESFEVKNPLSVSGVMGTEFEVSYMDDESVVRVVEGEVNTQDRQTGRQVVLQKERSARIRRTALCRHQD
ncbi:MAG: FecR family protein, partial [candidate division WOR-3 bacterium]